MHAENSSVVQWLYITKCKRESYICSSVKAMTIIDAMTTYIRAILSPPTAPESVKKDDGKAD